MANEVEKKIIISSEQKGTGIKDAKRDVNDLIKDVGKATKETGNLEKTALGVSGIFGKLSSTAKTLKNELSQFLTVAEKGTEIVEENNLFMRQFTNVRDTYIKNGAVSSEYYEKAIAYQKKLNDLTHLNMVENMKSQGAFFQLFNAQGVAEEFSYRLSESLSNAAIDLSSLFNVDYDAMVSKLKSGIVGNTKPLRELGVDITEGSMQGVLDNLGIERTVDQLNFAEKELLRYRTIVEQVGFAQGDFAKTFDSSANQIRMFKAQIETIKQQVSAIFAQLVKNIGAYIRAALMIVSAFLKAIGSLFGVDWTDTGNEATSALTNIGDGFEEVGSGIGGATKAAKEFKKQLMGFDEINNITPPSQSSGGGGGGAAVGGGVSPELLKGLEDWDAQLGLIDNKAKEIANDFLKIFGLTIDENGELKKVDGKFDEILGIAKILIGVFASMWAVKKIAGFITSVKEVWSALKLIKDTAVNAVKGIVNFVTSIPKNLQHVWSDIKGGISILKEGFTDGWKKAADAGEGFFGKMKGGLSGFSKNLKELTGFSLGQLGLLTAEVGAIFLLVKAGIENMESSYLATMDTMDKETTKKSRTIGTDLEAFFYGVGEQATIFFQGIFGDNTQAAIKNARDEVSKLHDELKKTFEEVKTSYDDTINTTLPLQEKLNEKLAEQIDDNGKIKAGHKELAQSYIDDLNEMDGVNIEIKDNELYLNGEKMKSREELKGKVDEVIAKLKEEAEQEANIELYKEAVKNRIKVGHELDEAEAKLQKAKEDRNEQDIKTYTELVNNLKKEKSTWATNEEYYNNQVLKDTEIKAGQISDTLIGNATTTKEDVEKALKGNEENFHKSFDNLSTFNQQKLLQMYGDTNEDIDKMSGEWKKFAQKSPEEFEVAMGKMSTDQKKHLLEMLAKTGEMTPALKQGFVTLADESTEAYDEVMKNLPDDVKDNLGNITKAVELWKDGNNDALADAGRANAEEYDKAFKEKAGIKSPSKVMKQDGEYLLQGLKEGINSSYYQNQTTQALKNYCNRLLRTAKETMQIASPSKVTKQFGVFLMEGFEVGIEEEATTTQSVLQDKMEDLKDTLSQVSEYTADSLLIDTNSMIDYGNVEGKIDAKIDTSGLTKAVAMAVVQGMNQANVNVNIEATTDTGVVIKQVSEAMNDYVNQTGQLPFAIPM